MDQEALRPTPEAVVVPSCPSTADPTRSSSQEVVEVQSVFDKMALK